MAVSRRPSPRNAAAKSSPHAPVKPKSGIRGRVGGINGNTSEKRRTERAGKSKSRAAGSLGELNVDEISSDEAANRVKLWATGKDLVALLSTLGEFSQSFESALPQAAPDAVRGDSAALRKAYHRACLQLHPDKQAGASASTQAIALALFQSLSAAFVSLRLQEREFSC